MSKYILLHGGAAGSWIWKPVRDLLRAQGHEAEALTFTGFGDRRHLNGPNVTSDTHVADIVNALEFDDAQDVILVGHSYSGSIIPGVVAAAGSRIRRAVYLDALVLKAGECVAQAMGFMSAEQCAGVLAQVRCGAASPSSGVADQQRAMAQTHKFLMTAEQQEWMLAHLSEMPTSSNLAPVAVGAESLKLPVDYIAVTQTIMAPMHGRAKELGWTMHMLDGDHAILVGDAPAIAKLLLAMA